LIGKIVKRNSRVTEVTATACMSPSLLHCEMTDGATVERRDPDNQDTEEGSL